MTDVVWADSAKLQLHSIYSYIAQNSEQYALQVIDSITLRTADLAEHPIIGKAVPEYGFEQIREIVEPPYRIIYEIQPDRIEVIAVMHGRQDIRIQDRTGP